MNYHLPDPKNRSLYLAAQVDQASINGLSKSIIEINEEDERLIKVFQMYEQTYTPKPIKIYIDSYGGAVYQCLGLLGIMEHSKTPIETITTGAAMSAGFLIAIAGHDRFAYRKATFMYHQVSTMSWGKVKDIEDDMTEAKRLQKIIENHTLENTKITRKQLSDNFKEKVDWYMNTAEALKLGVIDKIL